MHDDDYVRRAHPKRYTGAITLRKPQQPISASLPPPPEGNILTAYGSHCPPGYEIIGEAWTIDFSTGKTTGHYSICNKVSPTFVRR